jgi:hypothetical protein
MYKQSLANFAWNLFHQTDLPLLASQSAPRSIQIAGAVDAANTPVPLAELGKLYNSTNVKLLETAAWNDTVLGAI